MTASEGAIQFSMSYPSATASVEIAMIAGKLGMSIHRNKALYRQCIDRCNAHDFDGLGEFVTEDVRANEESLGLERYIQGLADVAAAFPDYHWRLDHLLAEGDWICARFTDSGTHRGTFLGVAPTGRSVSTFELAVYRLVDGKIAEVWVTVDNRAIIRQLTDGNQPGSACQDSRWLVMGRQMIA